MFNCQAPSQDISGFPTRLYPISTDDLSQKKIRLFVARIGSNREPVSTYEDNNPILQIYSTLMLDMIQPIHGRGDRSDDVLAKISMWDKDILINQPKTNHESEGVIGDNVFVITFTTFGFLFYSTFGGMTRRIIWD